MAIYSGAPITDPDSLTQGVEVTITTSTKKIKLNVAGNLTTDGVTLKTLYSFLKEEWKNDSALIKFPFPMGPITDEQFELINGWDFDKTGSGSSFTPNLIRTGGWALKDLAGVTQEEWAGIVTLGTLNATTDQVYFTQSTSTTADSTNFVLTNFVNQAVKIFGDGTHGDFDYRNVFKIFVREQAKTYASSQLSDIGVSSMTYQVYRFPLANNADGIKITHDDTTISTTAPYTGMSITWYAVPEQRSIGGTNRDFDIIIDGNGGTAEQIYEFVQYKLRQTGDIDAGAGTKYGKISNELLKFVGDTLYTISNGGDGVFIDNYQTVDINRLVFADNTGTNRTFPYVAALSIQFGENLVNDANAIYRVFFTSVPSGDFGTSSAIIVKDSSNNDIAGSVGGSTAIQKSFAYDSNTQGGRTAGQDAEVTVVAIGLNTGQYVKATGTITRSTSNSISLVAPLERNYSNT